MSILHNGAENISIQFNVCLHIANTAFMDFCEPLVVALLYSTSGFFTVYSDQC